MVEDDARGSRIGDRPWPARPDDLLRTDLCPACFAPLGALVCGRCGLDVRAPEAAAVLEASHRVVDAVAERERLVDAMRRWSRAAAGPEREPAPVLRPVPDAAVAPPLAVEPPSVPASAPAASVARRQPVGSRAADAAAHPTEEPVGIPAAVRPEAAPAAPRRRISVPAVLLAVGVVLLSVAAVFYVVYAFVTYGLVVRAAITAAVTLAALTAAGVLARRRLPGTAEAVGLVGIVLLHLDVWAVRSYDLAGAASNDPFVHFGVGTLVVSVALLGLRRLLRIRAAGIAGWAGLPVAAGLLVGAVPSTDAGTRAALALAAASAVALVHAAPGSGAPTLPDLLERGILRVVGVAAAIAAVVAGAASAVDPDAVPALPLLVAAVASGAHAWALARPASRSPRALGDVDAVSGPPVAGADVDAAGDAPQLAAGADSSIPGAAPEDADAASPGPRTDPLRVLAAVVAGAGAAAALPVTALMGGSALLTLCAQLVAAALVAAALDVAARRLRHPVLAATARIAAVAALVVACIAGLPAAVAGLGGVTAALVVGMSAWEQRPLDVLVAVLGRASDLPDLTADVRAAVLGLVAVWILTAVASLAGRRLGVRRLLLAWTGAATVVAAVPALGPVVVVAGAYLVVSAGALAWRLSSRVPPSSPVAAPTGSPAGTAPGLPAGHPAVPDAPLLALSLAAGGLAWTTSWASTGTWWAVTPLVVLLLVVGSRTPRTEDAARLTTAGAALVGLVAAAALAPSLAHAGVIGSPPLTASLGAGADPVTLLLLGSALILLVAGVLPGRPGVRRRALLATVLLPACLTALPVAVVGADHAGGALTASPVWSTAAQAVLVAGLVAWTVGGVRRVALPARAPRADDETAAPRAAGTTALRRWRLTTGGLVAPALLLAVLTPAALVDRGSTPHGVVPAVVALVVAAAALLAYRHASRALRVALDVGAAVVVGGALIVAVSVDPTRAGRELLWIPLLVVAATALVLSVAHDGLLVSRSARRAWGWTALGTGIAALWSRLIAGGTTTPEAYWVPVAGVLLLVAALMHRAALRADGGVGDAAGPPVRRGVAALTLAGILTAVLPLAPAGRPDDVLRPAVLTGICAALALAAAAVLRRAPSGVRPLLRAVVIGGGIGLLVAGGVRALRLSADLAREPAVDLQLVVTAAVLAAVGALVLRGARDPADPRIAGYAWSATTGLVAVVMLASVGSGEGVVRPLVASVALVAGAAALLVLRSVHQRVLAASAAVALLGAVVVALLAWRGGYAPSEPAALAVPAIVAVLVSAVGAADRLRNPRPASVPGQASGPMPDSGALDGLVRHAADVAAGVLVVGTAAVGAATDGAGLPVALLLSGVAVLVASSGPASRRRRLMGWVALALGSAALWVALGRGGVDAVEPYVLPPAGVMLAVAALLHRGLPGRRRSAPSSGAERASGAAPVLLGALLLAALPPAVASWTGFPVRALVVGGVAAVVLLLTAAALRDVDAGSSTRPLLHATAAASGLAVPLVGFGRTVAQLNGYGPATFGRTESWTLAAALVLVLAVAVALVPARAADRSRHGADSPRDPARRMGASALDVLDRAPRAAVLVAAIGAGAVGSAAILRAHAERMDGVGVRSALLVALIAALHVACSPSAPAATGTTATGPAPATAGLPAAASPLHDRVLAPTALVVGALVAAVLVASGAADPVETVTVPIAAALLVVGARRLVHDASAGSMRHLTPGLLVLLVPPLLADLGPSPAWRIVGLGILALTTLLAGARLRLRAPFLIGGGVLVVHALAQLWPWIREASATVPWWAWAGVGGVVLIAVAARYERRIRDVKEVAARVSALR
ncbi:SCO7613 C-terminal domain-containing membrane protein [Clavibacter sp. km3a]|uniref:SCO7613 C-terminal domain-containing membrane protein n=1 Tax=Clavibacter sp. km3a TaxID=3459135 RepID=UPI004041A3C2